MKRKPLAALPLTTSTDYHGHPISGMGKWTEARLCNPTGPGWYVTTYFAPVGPESWVMRWYENGEWSSYAWPALTAEQAASYARRKLHPDLIRNLKWRHLKG